MMIQVAIYGKGGIGKSTTSSNLSYSLASKGNKVLQVGCDPKHDSTKYLIGAGKQTTVLDYVRSTPPSKRSLDDVLVTGSGGVMCIEAGGPEPGIGCAGRGILTTFDTLKKLGAQDLDVDVTLYDVLGDVVCGGFAVPMRNEYSDAVYIVTSGEFMAMYAANNILRGLLNFGTSRPRVAGLILNRRNVENESEIVSRFAKAVGLPVVAEIPRGKVFAEAEKIGKTVSEAFPDSEESLVYASLADDVVSVAEGKRELLMPRPLSDDQLNDLAAGKDIEGLGDFKRKVARTPPKMGIGSCASRGAVFAAGRVNDLPIVIHGPESCGYVMSHTQDVHYLTEIGTHPGSKAKLRNNILCTGMTNTSSIFGGGKGLLETLRSLAGDGKMVIMVITTCVPGMIGDDVKLVKSQVESEYPGLEILLVEADGNLTGDSEEGREMALREICTLIDPSVKPSKDAVNVIDDNFILYQMGHNRQWAEELMASMGFPETVRVFDDISMDEVRNIGSSRLSVMTFEDETVAALADELRNRGIEVLDRPIPRGYRETLSWLEHVGELTGRGELAVKAIEDVKAEYAAALEKYRPILSGKTVDVVTGVLSDSDWLLETLVDAGMTVEHVYTVSFRRVAQVRSRYVRDLMFVNGLRPPQIRERLEIDKADVVVGGAMVRYGNEEMKEVSSEYECFTHKANIKYMGLLRKKIETPMGKPGWRSWGDE